MENKNVNNEIDSKYYKLDDKTILSVKIPQDVITKWFEGRRRKISLFICLDISGSMCGPPISQAKTAILKLLEELFSREILTEKDVTCMFFDTACDVVRFADDPNMLWKNGAIRSFFDTVDVRGGTQFACVFNSIIDNLKKIGSSGVSGDSDLAIIFFTDGQSSRGEEFEQSKSKLSKSLLETSFKTEVHTVGFSAYHDAVLLSWLTKCGSKEGNFQYVESSEDIPGTMETTLKLLEISDKNLYLKIGDNQILQTYFDNEGLGTIILTSDLATKIDKITVFKESQVVDVADDDKYEISLPPRQILNDDPTSVLMLIPFIQLEIIRLSNEIINDDNNNQETEKKQKFNEITKLANKYEDQLNVILQNAYKSRTAMRRTIIQQILEVKSSINHFKSILSEALKGALTNEKIANFNNIAYKNITKQRLRTRLDNRAVKNIDKMEDIEKKIMQAVDSLDFDQMEKEETEENLTTFICSLSTDNYIEAMKEGECICLTLDISRSQAAIADPSQIKINKINQSLLSSIAFFDSVKYALDQGNVSAEEVHGGFRLDIEAKAVEGMARESITGILPLYINEKHWSIAKEKMKPILGYMTTLDIFGYSYSQITTVPYLILSKSLSNTSTEFHRRQFKLIFETCDAIYKQSNYLRDDNKKLFEDYLKSPLNRTIDIVPNCMVYLGHLLYALKCKDVNLPDLQRWLNDGLIEYLIEETIRRKFNKLKSSEIIKEMDVSKAFKIDKKKYIEDPVDEFKINYEEYFKALLNLDKSSKLRYSNAAKLALQENLAEISNLNLADSNVVESIAPPNIKIQLYDPETFQVSNFIIEKIKDIVVESVEIILRFKKIFEYLINNNDNNNSMDSMFETLLKNQEFHFFEDQTTLANSFFDKYSPKTLLATFFQSYQHRQNHERRDAIISESTKSKYFEPFSDKTAESIIEFYFNEYISTNLQIKSSEIVKGYENEKENEIGLLFWNLKTEEEAAGLLLTDVKYRGHKLFGQVLKALQKNSLNSPKEKIIMVLKGKWKGIRLFFDKPKNPEDSERFISNDDWHPSRRTIYRIMKAQRNQIPQIEWWIELLPRYKEYFELQFNDELMRKILNEKYEARQENRKNNLKLSS